MSIEDIAHLKINSIKQTCVILIDSKNRDFSMYPDPNNYVVNFNVPFKNVIGFDIIDTSIPRTMYSIDKYNNSLYLYIHTDIHTDISFEDIINSIDINNTNDPTFNGLFKEFKLNTGDYNLPTFIDIFNTAIADFIKINFITKDPENPLYFVADSLSIPTELTDFIQFKSKFPFIFNMKDSTIAETLGFNLFAKKELHNLSYYFIHKFMNKPNLLKLYCSYYNTTIDPLIPIYNIIAPGMVCFTGEKYILLRSPEIEEHAFGSLAYTNNNLGIAKFRTNSLGFNDEKLYITKIPIREFHPIGKLSKLSIRFETADRKLYDFKGVNHNITLAIYYYEPKFKQIEEFNSILNPNYTTNFNNYKYTNDEQEIINEDDDDEDDINEDINENFSRDNINIYRKMEEKFNY
jgi:hypothetical protein